MANRRPQNPGRRFEFGRNDRPKSFGRTSVSPWLDQGTGPAASLPNLLPLGGNSTEATLALANNLINNLLQQRQQPVPSLLDMPIRREFNDMGRGFDRSGYGPQRMGNQGNYRRTGNVNQNRSGPNAIRRFKPGDGQRNHNRNQRKEADNKAKPVKESSEPEPKEEKNKEENADTKKAQDPKSQDEKKGQDKDQPKTRYDNINTHLLKCHICNKTMWDGRSFENHLNGRAHAIMMQKTAESYALTADTMRQEFKIREMKRNRRAGQQTPRDFYCAMCDLFAANGAAHRMTVGHRKLKKYLHPACNNCHKEMPTRIELDEHRLTPEHLMNINNVQEPASKQKPDMLVISTLATEQMYVREDRQRRRRDHKDNSDGNDEENAETGDANQSTDDGEVKKEQEDETNEKEIQEPSNIVLDFNEGDDASNIKAEDIPPYKTERGVGQSYLTEFRCIQCVLCNKLLDCEETAQVHLRTWRHHHLFVKMLKEKAGLSNPESNKRPLNSEEDHEETEAKRVKTEDNENAENGGDLHDDEAELNDTTEADDWNDDEKTEDQTVENGDGADQDTTVVLEEPELKKEATPDPSPTKKEVKPKGTPRGRGRGRGRARN